MPFEIETPAIEAIGIVEDDFKNNPLADFGVTVSWYKATKTISNISGQESLTYSDAIDKTGVFVKRGQRYVQTNEGLVDLGDAVLHVPSDYEFSKDDRIKYRGELFIIV